MVLSPIQVFFLELRLVVPYYVSLDPLAANITDRTERAF